MVAGCGLDYLFLNWSVNGLDGIKKSCLYGYEPIGVPDFFGAERRKPTRKPDPDNAGVGIGMNLSFFTFRLFLSHISDFIIKRFRFLSLVFLILFYGADAFSINATKKMNVAVHQAFYPLILDIQHHFPHSIRFHKIRGAKLRFLINWGFFDNHYDAVIGADRSAHSEQKLKAVFSDSHSYPIAYATVCIRVKKQFAESLGQSEIIRDSLSALEIYQALPKSSVIVPDQRRSSLGKLYHQWCVNNGLSMGLLESKHLVETSGWSSAHRLYETGTGIAVIDYLPPKSLLRDQDLCMPITKQFFYLAVSKRFTNHKLVEVLKTVLLSDVFQNKLQDHYLYSVKSKESVTGDDVGSQISSKGLRKESHKEANHDF